jgi:peptidyl-tRNA hydrolase, PTH1 family
VVGLGNPGSRYERTRHNIGARIADELSARWGLSRRRTRWRGRVSTGRAGPGGPRVAVLVPQTFMNDSGRSVGPARGELRVPLERVLVLHDEIDLPFGQIRTRLGGGLAGHNGLKSLRDALGSPDFMRVRVGVGRPPTTDPDEVAAYVLSGFREPPDEVQAVVERAADEAERAISSN